MAAVFKACVIWIISYDQALLVAALQQVLEPKDDKILFQDWDDMKSEIGNLGVAPDDDQSLPTNVMYPGTSEYWRSDFDGY